MCKNIYVDFEGNISLNKGIRLATVEDLNNYACACGEEFGGLLQLENGKYLSTTLEMLEEQGIETDGSETADYTFIDKSVPRIYKHFIENIDQTLYEIVTMKMSSDNTVLYVVVLPRGSNNFYHIHNVWLDENEEIKENCSMLPKIFIDVYKIA